MARFNSSAGTWLYTTSSSTTLDSSRPAYTTTFREPPSPPKKPLTAVEWLRGRVDELCRDAFSEVVA